MSEEFIKHYYMVEDLKPLVYILALVSVTIVLYSTFLAYRRVFANSPPDLPQIGRAMKNIIVYGLLQRKVVRSRGPGLLHVAIFAGMLWLLIMTSLRALDTYFGPFLVGSVWIAYKFLGNVAGALVIIGTALAAYRRIAGLTPNLPKDGAYYLVYALFLFIAITGFMLTGMLAAAHRGSFESPYFDPIGYIFYLAFSNLSFDELRTYYRALWVTHLFAAQMAIALIPFTNLWHIIAAGANIALARGEPAVAQLRSYPDIEERLSRGEGVGIYELSRSSWKQRLEWEACTSCMRCTNSCPAFAAGKPLSPQRIMISMRDLLRRGSWQEKPWDGAVESDAAWSCVTCGACVEECPVLIHQVDTILDLRRGMLFADDKRVPEGVLTLLSDLQQFGNPMRSSPVEKETWMEELRSRYGDEIVARPGESYDYLYWPGCIVTYDPRLRGVATSLLDIMVRLGYKVAVMPDPVCSGDPALRVGEELMFLEKASEALEALSKYQFRKLLVTCPHCYNAFKWDYKRYSEYFKARLGDKASVLDKLEVEHHSVLLAELVRSGKIAPGSFSATVTYHDPCYLGRWNKVYEEPRAVLGSVKKLRLYEMPRNRDKSFCCGGGGGQLFYEVAKGQRISKLRSEEAAKTLEQGGGRKVLAVACPFCNVMFRGEADQHGFEVKDIAEILSESLKS